MVISKENKKLKEAFGIFTNEYRLEILNLLKTKKSMSVGQVADRLNVPFKTASKYLLFLSKKGILDRKYDGPFVLYKLSNSLSEPTRSIIFDLFH